MSMATRLEPVMTPYGCIHNAHVLSRWENGAPRACRCLAADMAPTPQGWLMPLYDVSDIRRGCESSFTLYPNGMWRSLELQNQTPVATPLGLLPAEWLSWYPGGALKRILTRKGRLSGYWTEKDEAALAPNLTLLLPPGHFTGKVQGLRFYPGGQCASVTLWPGEVWNIPTPVGPLPIRYGCAFYEDGSVKSCEPAWPVSVPTALGDIRAFDPEAQGICGDVNSLKFARPETLEAHPDADGLSAKADAREALPPEQASPHPGPVLALSTVNAALHCTREGRTLIVHPRTETDQLTGLGTIIVPLHLGFDPDGLLAINDGLVNYTFAVEEVRVQPHISLPDMRAIPAGDPADARR